MALKQNEWSYGRKTVPDACRAGAVTCAKFDYTIKDGETLLAADIVELGGLIAFNEIVRYRLVHDAAGGTTTAKVGLLSGKFGEEDDSRTLGSEFYAAQSVVAAGVNNGTNAEALLLDSVDYDRGIGLQLSADTTASGSDITFTLIVEFCPKQD